MTEQAKNQLLVKPIPVDADAARLREIAADCEERAYSENMSVFDRIAADLYEIAASLDERRGG